MKTWFRCLASILLSAAAGQLSAADVGRVLLAAGDAVAVRGSQTLRLALGSVVQDKDLLRTGPASSLQVRFTDESIVSLRENTEFRIDEFRYTGKEDGSERAFFRLLKGGLRTVTGLVGRSNNRNYALTSVVSTIGIRGTDFSTRLCQQDCVKPDGTREKDGQFGTVHGFSHGTNRIDVSSKSAQKVFGKDQHFFTDGVAIEQLIAPPAVLAGHPVKPPKPSSGTGKEQTAAGGAGQDPRSAPEQVLPTVLTFVAPGPGQSGLLPFAGGSEPPTIAGVGAFMEANAFGETGDGGGFFTVSNLTTDPAGAAGSLATQQKLLAFTLPAGSHASGSVATTGDSGGASYVIDQTVTNSLNAHWGIWNGTIITTDNGITVSPAGGFHYLYGPLTPPETVAAKTGSFSLSIVQGTTPTNNLNETGTFSGFGTINFTTRSVSFSPSSFSFPSQSWSFSGHVAPLQIVPGKGAFVQDTVSGSCSGTGCGLSTPSVLGTTGVIAGTRGDHLLTAHQARTVSGPNAGAQTVKIYSCSASNC